MVKKHVAPKGARGNPLDYTIAAIPTMYRGRQYRSRLEAKWAAFFDLLGWRHEYEPYDLGAWSPDFLVSQTGEFPGKVLVEVKPKLDEETFYRMLSACDEKGVFSEDSDIYGIVLVGASPETTEKLGVRVGWLYQKAFRKREPADASILWSLDDDAPVVMADFAYVDPTGAGWFTLMSGDAETGAPSRTRFYKKHTLSLWSRASNAVQWLPQ